ncbi:MAG: pilus assembly protein PilM [Synergistes sp.]|nr:pilus assembly protein PilM [Synergistes sp.]
MGLFARKSIIRSGLVFERDSFRFLSLRNEKGTFDVTDAVCEEYPEYLKGRDVFADFAADIGDYFSFAVSRLAVKDLSVNLSLPFRDVMIRTVNFPKMSTAEAALAFRYDFGNYFPFPIEEGVFDMAEIKYPCESGRRFVVAAARRKLIENIEDAAKACGIRIKALEPAQIAAERSVTQHDRSDGGVYIYVGEEQSFMIFSWKKNGIYYRSIQSDAADVLAFSDGESDIFTQTAERFADEVRLAFTFGLSQNAGFNAENIYLFGRGASKHLCKFVSEAIDGYSVKVTSCADVHNINIDGSGWEIAVGLAMR